MISVYTPYDTVIVWLRRDLRLDDNTALYEACCRSRRICCVFVVDPSELESDGMGAPLLQTIFKALRALRTALRDLGSDLALVQGKPAQELPKLAQRLGAQAVFFNEDYEPQSISRDAGVSRCLQQCGVAVHQSLDHVYFGAGEILTAEQNPYRNFAPYKRRWLEQSAVSRRLPLPSRRCLTEKLLSRDDIGATPNGPAAQAFVFPGCEAYPEVSEETARELLDRFLSEEHGAVLRYKELRDVPSASGTSYLSPQLRAGTIGIRTCVEHALTLRARVGERRAGIDSWIGELIWRDFYQMILRKFPHVAGGPFLLQGTRIAWRDDGVAFDSWRQGRTGYPFIDAGMRQLNQRGWMHNRLRMAVASFLTKDLLIDWRRGERYFEQHLADADTAQNNGGWQWSASTGVDAAPYFRIFNPVLQGKRFDPEGRFVKEFVPELSGVPATFIHEPWRMPPVLQEDLGIVIGRTYPRPLIDHAAARERALAAFSRALR